MAKPVNFSNQRWHVWSGSAYGGTEILVSDEEVKSLTSHRGINAAINYLWGQDRKAARELEAYRKENEL